MGPGEVRGNGCEIKGMVEKPKAGEAPSRLAIIGRYILHPSVFRVLDRKIAGTGAEIQLTDALARLIGEVPFHAVRTGCRRYDCGNKVGFLEANIALGLKRPEIAQGLRTAIERVLAEEYLQLATRNQKSG